MNPRLVNLIGLVYWQRDFPSSFCRSEQYINSSLRNPTNQHILLREAITLISAPQLPTTYYEAYTLTLLLSTVLAAVASADRSPW